MHGLIVVTGLDRLASSERWSRLIEPLAAELQKSGLGDLPDLTELTRELHEKGLVDVVEVAIRLKNLEYGREFVDRVTSAAGLGDCERLQPQRWRPFHCEDYFSSKFCKDGYWDESGQYWYVVPFDQVFENEESGFLDVGGAGVDGIRFGYRRGHGGLWAYPIDGEFRRLADTVDSFLRDWLAGKITL
jgi:hypothetical protein